VPLPSAATAIAAGNHHSLTRLANGTVWAWGRNAFGELGNRSGGSSVPTSTPQRVEGVERAVSVAAGWYHSLATIVAVPAKFIVDSTDDQVDAHPGDGRCASSAGGCTMRAAIQEVNALGGGVNIKVPSGTYRLSVLGRDEDGAATGDLDIRVPLRIEGSSAETTVVDGGGLDRVLEIHSGGTRATIAGMTIRGGDAAGYLGGGIYARGAVTLERVVLRNNTAGLGGGLFHQSASGGLLDRVRVESNTSTGGGGAGIYTWGFLTIQDTVIRANQNFDALFVHTALGEVRLDRSTVEGNALGISNRGPFSLVVQRSTISGNELGGIANGGELKLWNVTLADNRGIGVLTGLSRGDGARNDVRLANTIIARNDILDCSGSPFISNGHNIDGDGSCGLTATGDRTGIDPLIGELADNGGPTRTHALQAESPAIDAASLGCANTSDTDQRGQPRPVDGNGDGVALCDIGAYEAALTNRRPTISAGGPYVGVSGTAIELSAVGQDPDGDDITYAWDLNDDGVFETQNQRAWVDLRGAGTVTVMVQGCDSAGVCTRDSTTVEVIGAGGGSGGGSGEAPSLAETPELGSLSLFGAGAAGLFAYALGKARGMRRRRPGARPRSPRRA